MRNGSSILSVLVVFALMGMASAAVAGYSCSVTPSSSSVEAGQSVFLSTPCF